MSFPTLPIPCSSIYNGLNDGILVCAMNYTTQPSEVRHFHDFSELVFVIRGVGCHETENGYRAIRRGNVFLIRPEEKHGYGAIKRLLSPPSTQFPTTETTTSQQFIVPLILRKKIIRREPFSPPASKISTPVTPRISMARATGLLSEKRSSITLKNFIADYSKPFFSHGNVGARASDHRSFAIDIDPCAPVKEDEKVEAFLELDPPE